jgi:hypothetical protein
MLLLPKMDTLSKVGTVVGPSRMPAFAIRFGVRSMLLNGLSDRELCRRAARSVVPFLRFRYCGVNVSTLGGLTAAGPDIQFLGVSSWLSLTIIDLRSGQPRKRFGEPNRLPNITNTVPWRYALAAMILTVNVTLLSKQLNGGFCDESMYWRICREYCNSKVKTIRIATSLTSRHESSHRTSFAQ